MLWFHLILAAINVISIIVMPSNIIAWIALVICLALAAYEAHWEKD